MCLRELFANGVISFMQAKVKSLKKAAVRGSETIQYVMRAFTVRLLHG